MGILSGLSRRKFMQHAGAGVGGFAASKMFGGRARAQGSNIIMPRAGKKFADVQLTYFQDSLWLHAPLWLSPIFQKDAGVSIKRRELYEGGDTMAKVLPELLSKNPRFELGAVSVPVLRSLGRDRAVRTAGRLSGPV
jgi:hypothetical protein